MFLFSLSKIGILRPPGSRGFAADRCPEHPEENGAAAKLLFAEQML